jgi:hypothetical protein
MGAVETGAKHGFYAVAAGSAGAAAIGRSNLVTLPHFDCNAIISSLDCHH